MKCITPSAIVRENDPSRDQEVYTLGGVEKNGQQQNGNGQQLKTMGAVTLHIRRYEDRDWDEVWHLHNLALTGVGAHAGNGPWDEDLRAIHNVYLSNAGEFLVGSLDEQIVAMGALKRTSNQRAEIKRMRVHPDHQRKGFGRAILLELETRAVELGYSTVHLDTTLQQTAAQRLYEQSGYAKLRQGRVGDFECVFFEKHLGNRT